MIMKRIIAYLVCFSFVISAAIVFAEIKSLIKEYTYQASELDSKTSCRAIALEQVKRELLEELGTYVESTTIVQDAQIDQDEIRTISAGVVQTKILDEKWDGKSFWLKAEVSADPDEVATAIEKVRNDQKLAEELAESESEKEKALQEIERLQAELAQSNADKEKLAQYNQAITQLQASDSYQQGTAMTVAGDYEGATQAYDRVIYLRPEDPKAYFGRSVVYIYLGNYQRATQDLDRAMVIRPAYTNVYFQRASGYKHIRETRLVNDPRWVRQHPGLPLRPVVPKHDTLKRFLDNKQTQHKLVKVNPFHPPPVVKRDPRRVQPRPLQVKREKHFSGQPVKPDIRKKGNLQPRELDRRQERPVVGQPVKPGIYKKGDVPPRTFQQKQEKPVVGQPVKPGIYKKGDVPPPTRLERKPPIVTPRVDEPRGIQKRDLNEEQKRVVQQQKKVQDNQRALEMQQRQNLRKKEGSFARDQVKPEVRRQVNVPPPPQPRVERRPPPVQPRRDVYTPKAPQQAQQQKVRTKKQEKDEELEKSSRRR
jgi:tetratricopeptide (TPR) repeat protein